MQTIIDNLGFEEAKKDMLIFANELGVPSELHIEYVFNVFENHREIAPTIRISARRNIRTDLDRLKCWVENFKKGYDNRISQRVSKLPQTVPDNAVNVIIRSRFPNLTEEDVETIIDDHRLGMSAENILGHLLEEFLFDVLSKYGWAMAWGETVRAVDFCNIDGELLQIKNRSNSENSSSSKIREGTTIKKWYRVNALTNKCEWDKLTEALQLSSYKLNEDAFLAFIKRTLLNNPDALAVEKDFSTR